MHLRFAGWRRGSAGVFRRSQSGRAARGYSARCAPFVAEKPHFRKCPIADRVFFAQPLARAIWFRLAEGNVMRRSRGALAAEFVGHLAALGWIPAALA